MAFQVELPGGGRVQLQSADECDLWKRSSDRYRQDYHLVKLNDLVLLGAILQQQILLYRTQRRLNGEEPVIDPSGVPTGQYKTVVLESDQMAWCIKMMTAASDQIMKIEKALGIDKVSRESGGAHNVADYLKTLKRAAALRGVHISKRVLAYEEFVGELRWRVRIWKNADAEDRQYHNISPEQICDWAADQLAKLEQVDKDFAHDRGKLFVGKL